MKQLTEKEKNLQEVLLRIGENIRARRLKKKMTQFDLAEAIGCHQDNISRIETGKVNLTIEYLFNIAESLNVTIYHFFK
jgi:transcriptional regulator with XRE-family HTH domain